MNSDMHQSANKVQRLSLNRIIVIASFVYFVIEFLWQRLFTSGSIGGIYWLFIATEKLSLPLTILVFTLAIILLIIAIIMRLAKRDRYSSIAKTAGTLFLSSLLISGMLLSVASFYMLSAEIQHLDTLQSHNRLYYLTAYSAFDTNYALYQCDSVGIFCKQVYRSNDFMPKWFYAKLVYYAVTEEVVIEVKDQGEIYRHKLP